MIFPLSVQFSRSVVSDSLQSHESQHTRPPCPSPTHGVHSDSRPSSQWCHPAILSSVIPFSSCPQSFSASESFPMSQLFTWGGQSTGISALASFLPKKSQGRSPSEWTGWISLQSRDSQESSPTPQFESILRIDICFVSRVHFCYHCSIYWFSILHSLLLLIIWLSTIGFLFASLSGKTKPPCSKVLWLLKNQTSRFFFVNFFYL